MTNDVLFTRSAIGDNRGTLESVSLQVGATPRVLISELTNYLGAAFSPDGNMLAFISEISGQPEAYVTHYGTDGLLSNMTLANPRHVNALGWKDEGGGLMSLRMMSDNIEYTRYISLSGQQIQLGDIEETGRKLDKQNILPAYDGIGNVHSVRKGENEKPMNHLQLMTNWLSNLD